MSLKCRSNVALIWNLLEVSKYETKIIETPSNQMELLQIVKTCFIKGLNIKSSSHSLF